MNKNKEKNNITKVEYGEGTMTIHMDEDLVEELSDIGIDAIKEIENGIRKSKDSK